MSTLTLDKPAKILCALFPCVAIGLLNGLYKEKLYTLDPLWFWLFDIFQFVVLPAGVLYALAKYAGVRPSHYGFRLTTATGLVGLTLLATFLYWMAYEPVRQILWEALDDSPPRFTYLSVLPDAVLPRFALVLYMAASAALVEETRFRGLPWLYFQERESKRWAPWLYVLSSATFFAFIHSENGLHEVGAAFVLGIVGCLLYMKIKNLWPLVGAHFCLDVAAFW